MARQTSHSRSTSYNVDVSHNSLLVYDGRDETAARYRQNKNVRESFRLDELVLFCFVLLFIFFFLLGIFPRFYNIYSNKIPLGQAELT